MRYIKQTISNLISHLHYYALQFYRAFVFVLMSPAHLVTYHSNSYYQLLSFLDFISCYQFLLIAVVFIIGLAKLLISRLLPFTGCLEIGKLAPSPFTR